MLPSDTKLISVDDHVIEHRSVWTDRLPQKFRDAGPRVIEVDGGEAWVYEDQIVPLDVGVVRIRDGINKPRLGARVRYEEMRPGCYEPNARLDDMDIDGVWASLCFPNFTRFAGHRFLQSKDRALGLACISAYNDFIVDEWCGANRERLIPMAILPLWDVRAAVGEIERLSPRGVKAVAFSENPVVLGLPSVHTRHWDPLWAAVQEADLAVCMHIGSSSVMMTSSPEAPSSVMFTMFGVNAMVAFSDWIFSGVFDRFPRVRAVLSEGGAGWIPYMLERAEKTFGFLGTASGAARPPRELFAEHMYACMVTDAFAVKSLEDVGVDNLMWESDYPHNDGVFPHSRKVLEETLADVPEADAVKIARTNAERVFRL